jgi:hypothetical protein
MTVADDRECQSRAGSRSGPFQAPGSQQKEDARCRRRRQPAGGEQAQPCQQHRPAPVTVGERTVDDRRRGKSGHEQAEREARMVGIGMERADDPVQRRQAHIDRQRW